MRLKSCLSWVSLLVAMKIWNPKHLVPLDQPEAGIVSCLRGHLLLDELIKIMIGPVAEEWRVIGLILREDSRKVLLILNQSTLFQIMSREPENSRWTELLARRALEVYIWNMR